MACLTCQDKCSLRFCVDELLCALDCGCGCCHIPITLGANLDLKAGTLLGQRTSDQKFYPYDPFANDGTQVLRGFLKYHLMTDADGHVINRHYGFFGIGLDCDQLYSNMYYCGTFRTQDLVGDIASAVASNVLKLVTGSVEGPGLVRL